MPERLKAILDKITAWWKKFNTKQRSVLISIVAVVIVALVILGVVISRPTQVELVEAQSASEASTIKGVLEDNNISYEVDSKLVFFVNKSDEVNAIMALGDNGIPAQAYSIDNVTDGSFSTTEADKQKKYQVYLEDKLKDHLEKQSYFVTGKNLDKKAGIESIEDETAQAESDAEEIRKPENVVSLLQVDPIELEFGYGIIPLADVNQGGDLLDRVVMIRRQIALELGTVVPIIRLRDNIQLNPNQYIIKIKGIQVTEGEILFDHYMAMNPGYVEEEITGIPTFEPSFHLPAIWITESQRERAESLGYTVVDPPSIIATHLTEVIRSHIAELLTRQDVQNLVNNLKESNPVIVDELIPKLLGLGEIQKVLQNLLSEGISIRDLLTIFETLADHAQTTRDTDVLTEYVRQGLKRAISSKYFPANETTSVITLDPAVEQEIMSSVKQTEQGSYLSLDPDRIKAIIKSVETEIGKLESLGKSAIIITSPIVRMYFKKMTEDYFKDLIVLSYNEVESNVELQSVGMVTA